MLYVDPALPASGVLLGPDASDVVSTAYASIGISLEHLEIRQVLHEPGSSLSVRYAATLSAGVPGGDEFWVEPVVAAIDADGPVEGALTLEAGDLTVGLFRWPHDPALPGLVAAADTAVHPQWWAHCGDDLVVDVLTYRPGRRAVLHGHGAAGEVYLKVLTPRRARRTGRMLRELAAAGVPVPNLIGSDEAEADGVLVLEALPGRTLRHCLTVAPFEAPPSPVLLLDLLDGFPASWSGSARTVDPPSKHASRHARLLLSVVPEIAADVDGIVTKVEAVRRGAEVAVHGDFHDDQVLVTNGRIAGLLDVDGAGAGCREDDLGTFLAHALNVSLDNRTPEHLKYVDELTACFSEAVDPSALAAQTAAALLGLATGPYRVQEPSWRERVIERVELSRAWAERM